MQTDTGITTSDTDNPIVPSLSSIQNKDGSYFRLPEELDYSELDSFLSVLGIERKDIVLKEEYLLILFQHEMRFVHG